MPPESEAPRNERAIWQQPGPGRVIGKGHPIGDFLEAHEWKLVEERTDFFRLDVHLVDAVKNYRGGLFGGFAPTYVDLIALRTLSAGRPLGVRGWLVTVNMRLDYFEPVVGPRFFVESEVKHRRGRNALVETRFLDDDDRMLVFAITTLRELEPPSGPADAPQIPRAE